MVQRLYHMLLVAVVIIATSNPARAQTLDDTGIWLATVGNGVFKSLSEDLPLHWSFDTHYRMRDDSNGFDQSILRPGLGLKFAEDQILWAGYAWINNSPVSGDSFDEHRFWQQWTATPSMGAWSFQHRSRLEQRWLETGDDIGMRWRQMHRVQKTLSGCPQWSLIAWDEAFFHLNDTDWGAEAGFDQNRAFLGFGFKRCSRAAVRTEIGYLNQFTNQQGGGDGMNHILSINFFY